MAAPVWQNRASFAFNINAGEDLRIDVGARVSGADSIEEVFGAEITSWMDYDEQTRILTLTDAPIIRYDEAIEVRFRAWNPDGSSEADFVITLKGSVLASLHNSLYFKECLNYEDGRVRVQGRTTEITEMTDNDYNTYSTRTDININMSDSDGNPTAIDYIFVKYKGDLRQYTGTPIGGIGSGFTRDVPTTIKTIEGAVISLEVNDWKHDLYPLPTRQTANSVRMQFVGTGIQIYALMLLELGQEVEADESYTQIGFNLVDRSGSIVFTPSGRGSRLPPIENARWKWEYTFTMRRDTERMNAFRRWVEENPNCVFAPGASRDPEWVFPAYFPVLTIAGEYFTQIKPNGELVSFQIFEQ